MATTPQTATPGTAAQPSRLQELATRHLWMHFTRMGAFGPEHEVPIITRGDGCYVWDEHGNRYLDGLSALFCVNVGHGRTELGEAAAKQVRELGFFTNWNYAHPRAIELAARVAELAPGDLKRVFFTSGGSEAVESALKLARNYHRLRGEGQRVKVIAREVAYHGTSLGALLLPVGALGALAYWRAGHLETKAALLVALGLFVGAYFGAGFALSISGSVVKRLFAVLLAVVAVRMWWTA